MESQRHKTDRDTDHYANALIVSGGHWFLPGFCVNRTGRRFLTCIVPLGGDLAEVSRGWPEAQGDHHALPEHTDGHTEPNWGAQWPKHQAV